MTVDASLVRVTGPDHALYRPGDTVGIPLENSDGSIRLLAGASGIAGPGVYKEDGPLELVVNGVTYSCYVECGDCTVRVKAANARLVGGTVTCVGIRSPDPGHEAETVDVRSTFLLTKPERMPLPTPQPTR